MLRESAWCRIWVAAVAAVAAEAVGAEAVEKRSGAEQLLVART